MINHHELISFFVSHVLETCGFYPNCWNVVRVSVHISALHEYWMRQYCSTVQLLLPEGGSDHRISRRLPYLLGERPESIDLSYQSSDSTIYTFLW